MENLEEIAKELKQRITTEGIILKGNAGIIPWNTVFAAPLYEIKKDEKGNIIIEFNDYFKRFITSDEDTPEYAATKEFADKNNYLLQLKKYDMTPPKPKPGVYF